MRNRVFKLVLLGMAAAGSVVAWQRRNETPPLPPYPLPGRVQTSESFMTSGRGPTDTTLPGDAVDGGPAEEAGVVVEGRDAAEQLALPAAEGPADDLQKLSGVGPKLERLLNDQGITTYAQIAQLSDEQIDQLQARMPQFPGRIRRDDWVGQAKRLLEQ